MKVKSSIGFFGILLFFVGLLYPSILVSIGALFIISQPFIENKPSYIFRQLLTDRLFLLIVFLYVWIVLAGFYTQDHIRYIKDIFLKLPLVLLPIGLMCKDFYKEKYFLFVFITLNFLVFSVGLASFINFLIHKEELLASIAHAKAIPIITGLNHIYYSIILGFSTLASIYLSLNKIYHSKLKILSWIITVCNIVFLHSIAARTGLLGFYFAILVYLIYWGINRKKYLTTSVSLMVLAVIGVLSVLYIKPLNERYLKSVEDIETYMHGGDINHYSISMRLEYWEKSMKVFLKSPLIGVGKADVDHEMAKIFQKENSILIESNWKNPHNQFTQMLAGHGIIGFGLFMWILLIGVRKSFAEQPDEIYLFFCTIILFSFFFESVLERQAGIYFFSFFWFLLYQNNKLILANN